MLLKNFYLILTVLGFRQFVTFSEYPDIMCPNMVGAIQDISLFSNFQIAGYSFLDGDLRVGTGTTAPCITDYQLNAECSSDDITITQGVNDFAITDNYIEIIKTATIKNISNNTIVITEVGASCDPGLSSTPEFLFSRDVLDNNSKITLIPGAVESITYKIRFNYGTS